MPLSLLDELVEPVGRLTVVVVDVVAASTWPTTDTSVTVSAVSLGFGWDAARYVSGATARPRTKRLRGRAA